MTDKQPVQNFSDQLLEDLKSSGLTYKEMIDRYGMTRWGARKLGDHPSLTEENAGNHEKIFSLTENVADDSLLNTKIPVKAEEPNQEETRRSTSSAKQTITNKANTYLRKLEKEVKNTETPDTLYNAPEYEDGGITAIIHETDPHFSAHVKNRRGETTYDTQKADRATRKAFDWYISEMQDRNVDEIVLLLGGDLVEGENIYEGQAHKVEDRLDEQIRAARQRYYEEIGLLRSMMSGVPIKVVCISGNHGDLPVTSSSNADDIIYSQLEDMIDISDLQNVKFVRASRSDGVCFNYRGWKGYLTHGEHYRPHIGTSSPQSDWYAAKDQLGFDAAWRGHYHNQKQENVGGAPVYMTNSRKPGDDYTDKISVYGVTGNAIYFATDDEPVSEVKTQTQVLGK